MAALPLYESLYRAAWLDHSMRPGAKMTMIKIAPSILAADVTRLGDEVREVLDGGADYIHVDVMDGYFVPNLSFGLPVVTSLRRAFPEAFLDVHLMITKPGRYIKAFAESGASSITVHAEADVPEYIGLALEEIHSYGIGAGVSIRPKTPAAAAERWLDILDLILVMTVEPGFGGQHFITDTLLKIRELRSTITARGLCCDIEVDGGVTPATAPLAIQAGANVLVAGSAIFGQSDRSAAMEKLRCK